MIRLFTFLFITMIFFVASAESGPMGTLEVRGEAGPTQVFGRVKVQRCVHPSLSTQGKTKSVIRNCDQPQYFSLNQKQSLPIGNYIVGFEDTIYPGFVAISSQQASVIQLLKLTIPDNFPKDKSIRIYRDFSSLVEQRKIYFQIYYSGKHFFKLTSKYSFGDYYLTDGQRPDNIQWRTMDSCKNIKSMKQPREHAKFVCQAWNSATTMMDMADLYKFETANEVDGQFQEAWITEPGDVQAIRHLRHLVAAPMSAQDFVAVMPGVYKISADGKGIRALRIQTPNLIEKYAVEDMTRDLHVDSKATEKSTIDPSDFGGRISEADLEEIDPAKDCSVASVWRTESRTYCATDKAEGCDRATVSQCEPMRIDLRLRKY